MSIQIARQWLLNLKDLVQGIMYAFLAHRRLYTAMSPVLAFFLRPLLSITLISLALLQLWAFLHAPNKNIDGWLVTAGSLVSAVLNNISAFGGLIMRLNGQAFLIAPWLLVAGFGLSSTYRFILAGLHLCRALESQAHSAQRQHFLQAASFNLITAIQLASCTAAIVMFNLFPASTFLIGGFALSVVGLNMASALWRSIAHGKKAQLKDYVGLAKPRDETKHPFVKISCPSEPCTFHTRLFTTCDHTLAIKRMAREESREYLRTQIQRRLVWLESYSDEKSSHKKMVLQLCLSQLDPSVPSVSKQTLYSNYSQSLSNFWCEKSETEQLIDAVVYYRKHETVQHKDENKSSPSLGPAKGS